MFGEAVLGTLRADSWDLKALTAFINNLIFSSTFSFAKLTN